eukprot:TRINITY_DN2097_c0_g1_i1.p1 TRINITY_DN2097_c0_g1~~TRINITY_DN2097_c0_g1_i1.p1  ORF type:complete len:276 (-),score=41.87 TRINITY_DN2097_c0_g1_i1:238-1029(-)
MSYFIGVDGGGTKTKTVCVSTSRELKSQFLSGCTNRNSEGNDKARTHLQDGILGAIAGAGVSKEDVAGVCLGMSGVDRPEDKALMTLWVKEVLPHVQLSIHNDAVAALATGTEGRLYGVVVISGTGMIAYGFNKQGESARAAGFGPQLGDEGSGYYIGAEALASVVRARDGTKPKTALTEMVFQQLQIKSEDELIPWAYGSTDQGWQRYAALAPLVYKAYREGDAVAADILSLSYLCMINDRSRDLTLPTYPCPCCCWPRAQP